MDPVALTAVIVSGLVGLGGVGSGAWEAARVRRWQAGEERAVELRDVLDEAARNIAATMQPIALANVALITIDLTPNEPSSALLQEARGHLAAAIVAQRGLWQTSNRLRIRRGSDAPVALALKDAETRIGLLGALVRRRVANPSVTGYEQAWAEAEAAERKFYDAAAAELQADGKTKSN